MRDIKCRAWDDLNNRWIYGEDTTEKIYFRFEEDPGFYCGYVMGNGDWHDCVIVEYTGINDKNGNEIYEGDILLDDCEETFKVVFGKLPLDKSGDCVCQFPAFYAKNCNEHPSFPSYECNQIGEWMEIIGNIYENPELLSENKNER